MKFIIEHLEPRLYRWCIIEYGHISRIVGRENLIFTNIKTDKKNEILSEFGRVYREGIGELISTKFKNKDICLLDADAKETLNPKDRKRFDFFLFGGILGDAPPKKRAIKQLGDLKLAMRNLGREQMATDNAVYASKAILEGQPIEKIKFVDRLTVKLDEGEELILPFRYVIADGTPLISRKLLSYLKRKKGF